MGAPGAIAKRLCTGLQIRVGRFDSGSRLQLAGIAQLVERNLAKVEVASSRLVSRSRLSGESAEALSPLFFAGSCIRYTFYSFDGCVSARFFLKAMAIWA